MEANALKAHEREPAHKPSNRVNRLSFVWWLVALVVGVVTGAVGTVMYLNSYWTGSFRLPWGVLLALGIAALGRWWSALARATMFDAGNTGITHFYNFGIMFGFI